MTKFSYNKIHFAIALSALCSIFGLTTLPSTAGYVEGGTKKGIKEGVGGTKKGYGYAEGGTKKGIREGVGGTKKGWKETTKMFKKVF